MCRAPRPMTASPLCSGVRLDIKDWPQDIGTFANPHRPWMGSEQRALAEVLLKQAAHGKSHRFGPVAPGQLPGRFADQGQNLRPVDGDRIRHVMPPAITDVHCQCNRIMPLSRGQLCDRCRPAACSGTSRRRLDLPQPLLPVVRLTAQIHDRHDGNFRWEGRVDNGIWEAFQPVTTDARAKRVPSFGKFRHPPQPLSNFQGELSAEPRCQPIIVGDGFVKLVLCRRKKPYPHGLRCLARTSSASRAGRAPDK